MKTCVCGYRKGASWDEKEKHIGDEDFIDIVGMFFRNDTRFHDETRVSVIACPKCKTLKLND
jgi:hypothetical protein